MVTKSTVLDAHLVNSGSESVSLDAILIPQIVTRRLTLALNLRKVFPYQWENFDFGSLFDFNGTPIGMNEDGLFSLFDADNDAGANINAFFELVKSDYGVQQSKRIRRFFLGLETSGNMVIKTTSDDLIERTYLAPSTLTGQKQHRSMAIGGRSDQQGYYWTIRVENQDGCDFSIDSISALIMILTMGR